jgi:hypothetical protein
LNLEESYVQIIATLTLARPQIGKPDWAKHTRNVAIVAIHHRNHADLFEAFLFDDHAKLIGYHESKLTDFSHFIGALVSDFGLGRYGEGVVPIGPHPTGPPGNPPARVSLLARTQLDSTYLAQGDAPNLAAETAPLASHAIE